jgi:translocator protein
MNEIPMLSEAPAAVRAREGEDLQDLAGTREFGQAPSLEVSRRPPGRLKAAIIALICVVVTGISSYVFINPQMPSLDPVIEFPWFMPIGPYFTTIWVALMISMVASFYLILRSSPDIKSRRMAIAAYVAQFGLHTTWAWLLFADRSPMASLFAVAPFVVILVAAIWLTAQIDKRASFLLAPYLAWAIFALASTVRIATAGGS